MNAPNQGEKVVHVYDDIQEEDNHLPNWWLAILFGSIVFGFGYWMVYHTTDTLQTPNEVYKTDVEAFEAERAKASPTSPESLLALSKDPAAVEAGKQVFTTTCVACHGPEGAGLVGPNLTDKFWIHGAGPEDLLKAVNEGFPDKGMPPWGKMLGDEKTRNVVAFVLTLKGKNLPGKEPQGNPVE